MGASRLTGKCHVGNSCHQESGTKSGDGLTSPLYSYELYPRREPAQPPLFLGQDKIERCSMLGLISCWIGGQACSLISDVAAARVVPLL